MPTIDNLPAAGALSGTEPIPCTQGSSEAKQTTAQDIANLAAAPPALPLSIAEGGSGKTTAQAALDAYFASVTKGMLWTGDGTHITGVAVGTDGKVLTADSGAANGVSWQTPTPAPVTSVNSGTGAIVVQGTTGQITAGVAGSTTTLSIPTPLDYGSNAFTIQAGSSPTTVSWAAGGAWTVTATSTNQILISADSGNISVNLKPSGTLLLRGNTRVALRGPIGTNQSASGTTLGTVVKKLEIFNDTGASLGFLPIYDTIT